MVGFPINYGDGDDNRGLAVPLLVGTVCWRNRARALATARRSVSARFTPEIEAAA
jgi:hypothetical protein